MLRISALFLLALAALSCISAFQPASPRYVSKTSVSKGQSTMLFDFLKPKKSASASHILVTGTEAPKILTSLKSDILKSKNIPQKFAETAVKYSACPSGKKGGSLGTFKQGQMVPAFDKVVFSEKVGEVHGPVITPFGAHLILIESTNQDIDHTTSKVLKNNAVQSPFRLFKWIVLINIRTAFSTLTKYISGKKVLVLGDGDFSFSRALSQINVHQKLITSTLDSEQELASHFPEAVHNIQSILSVSNNNQIRYETDATQLPFHNEFDVILWNFPHIIGKTNIKHNRNLLYNFLYSAKKCLTTDGIIICALCHGQSGINCYNILDWKKSWKLPCQAADNGLVIQSSFLFEVDYYQSLGYKPQGRRGFGGGFNIRDASMYIIAPTTTISIPATSSSSSSSSVITITDSNINDNLIQHREPCIQPPIYVHEVHVYLDASQISNISYITSLNQKAYDICKSICIRHGVIDSLWCCDIVDLYQLKDHNQIAISFQLGYCNMYEPLSRQQADDIRRFMEIELPQQLNLIARQEKHGAMISKGYPHIVATILNPSLKVNSINNPIPTNTEHNNADENQEKHENQYQHIHFIYPNNIDSNQEIQRLAILLQQQTHKAIHHNISSSTDTTTTTTTSAINNNNDNNDSDTSSQINDHTDESSADNTATDTNIDSVGIYEYSNNLWRKRGGVIANACHIS